MKRRFTLAVAGWGVVMMAAFACGQTAMAQFPKSLVAGSALSISTTGSGKAVLYIVGLGQALRRDVQLGNPIKFAPGELYGAGHYSVFLAGPSSVQSAELDVMPASQPATLSFLAKPSRLPVDLPDGISGVVYVFDAFRNLILAPGDVSFELSENGGGTQTRTAVTRDGVAWVKLNSAPKAGPAEFLARAGNVSEKRVVEQVAGEPCNLQMTARKSGARIELETAPLRDCKGNAVPDGTVVTFTEKGDGTESTVDVPIKRGVARTDLPANSGATISVATGVVIGNEIRWRE